MIIIPCIFKTHLLGVIAIISTKLLFSIDLAYWWCMCRTALHRNSLNPESHIQLTNEKTIGEPWHSLTPSLHTSPYTFFSLFPFSPSLLQQMFLLHTSYMEDRVRVCHCRWEVWWEFPQALVWRWCSRRSHLSKPQAGVPHTHVTDIISIWWLSHKANCGHSTILSWRETFKGCRITNLFSVHLVWRENQDIYPKGLHEQNCPLTI